MKGGSSPAKAGRDPAPASTPSTLVPLPISYTHSSIHTDPLVYKVTSSSSDAFNISDITQRYRENNEVFATFTARKFEQDAKTLWIDLHSRPLCEFERLTEGSRHDMPKSL